jgi:parvulin-like peptidyl-prolyl isomerase
MSIVRMRKVFRSRKRATIGKRTVHLPSPLEVVFYLIIIIFVAGAYYTFGGPAGSGGQQGEGQGRVSAVVAKVNGQKISRALYDANLRRMEREDTDPTQARWTRTSTLNGLIDAFLMRQAAKTEAIKVTGADLKKKIDDDVEQTLNMKFPDPRSLRRYLKKQQMSLDAYKAELRKEVGADKEALREAVSQEKLQKKIEDRVTVSDDELKESYTQVRASHILIDPKKAAAAAQAKAAPNAAPVDGDPLAKQKADDLLAKIKAGADFAKLAKENSDDPGSAAKGGDLDWFKHGAMVKQFDEAAFKLQPGQVSEVVKSPFGYHIIKVTGRKSDLPKDFDKNKETYRTQVLSEKKYQAWGEYRESLKTQAQIEIEDPELIAYSLLDEAMKSGGTPDQKTQADAKAALEQAVQANPGNVTALWELANLLELAGDKAGALEKLKLAALNEVGARSPQIHIKLGELYEDQKQKDKAIAEYKDAFDRASAFTMTNYGANLQVEGKLKALGRADLAQEVTQWLDDYRKEQAKNPSGGMNPFGPMGGGGMPFTIPGQ